MGRKLKILVLEDVQTDFELMELQLEKENISFISKRVETKKDFKKELKDFVPDIILSDYSLPQFDGLSALKIAKEQTPEIPFIIVTGSMSEETAVTTMKAGAWDYVMKDKLIRLGPAVRETLKLKDEIEKRKLAEKVLMESEEMFRAVFYTAKDSIFIKDTSLRYKKVNTAMEELFGVGSENLINKTDIDLFGEEAGKHVMESDKQVLRGEIIEEFLTKPVDNVMHSFHTIKVPLKDPDGKITGICGIARDITERKKAEKSLKKSEEQLKAIVSNVPVVMWALDKDGIFTLSEGIGLKVLGLKPGEIVGQSIFDVYHEVPQILEDNRRALAGESFSTIVDMGNLVYESHYSPIRDDKGQVVGMTGLSLDITERKRVEKALSKERALLKALMDNIPDHIYFKDADSRFIMISNSHAKMFNLSGPAQAVGKTDFDFFTEEHARSAFDVEQTIIRTGQPIVGIEEKETWSDSPDSWVSTTKLPLRDENENIVGTFGVSRDITKRKQAENRIVHLNSVLKAIRNVNQLVVVEKDIDRLFRKVCDALIETRGYYAAWIGFSGDEKTFSVVKGSGFKTGVSRFIKQVINGNHPHCIKKALAQKEKFLIIDKSRTCGDYFFKDTCIGKETAVIRIEHAGRLLGLLAILLAPGISIDDEEITLLQEVAGDIAFAIHDIEMEKNRKQADEALRESEQKLRNIFENSTNLFYSHTPEHILTYLSPQVKDILGYTKEEALIKWTELASDNPINEIGFKHTLKAIETGKPQPPYELELVHKSGKNLRVEVREAPVVKNGKTVSIVGALTDITERKKAEEALRESEEKYRGLIEGLSETLYRISLPDGTYEYLGSAAKDVFGYSAEEFLDKPLLIRELIHPEFADYFKEQWANLIEGKVPPTYEYKIIDPVGKERWISTIKQGNI